MLRGTGRQRPAGCTVAWDLSEYAPKATLPIVPTTGIRAIRQWAARVSERSYTSQSQPETPNSHFVDIILGPGAFASVLPTLRARSVPATAWHLADSRRARTPRKLWKSPCL